MLPLYRVREHKLSITAVYSCIFDKFYKDICVYEFFLSNLKCIVLQKNRDRYVTVNSCKPSVRGSVEGCKCKQEVGGWVGGRLAGLGASK